VAFVLAVQVCGQTPSQTPPPTPSRQTLPPRPPYPDLDNLLPTQAKIALQTYRQALSQWQDAVMAVIRSGEGLPPIVVPPQPVRPDFKDMTADQRQAAFQAYREQMIQWRLAASKASAAEQEVRRKAGILPSQAEMERINSPSVALPADYAWRSEAANSGLTPATVAQLERDSVAIAGPYFRQSFEVYTGNPQPPFVTSDSLLNGFQVLLEDSAKRFELMRAAQLRQILEEAWTSLDARLDRDQVSRTEIEPFARHLAFVIGPALRLLGSNVPLGGPDVEAAVASEVSKIEGADAVILPAWLAPAEPDFAAIDYRRCRPIGFYASSTPLSRYYEATRWLQMIPLRASRDSEVGAAGLLAALLSSSDPRNFNDYSVPSLKRFIAGGAAMFGETEGLDVTSAIGDDMLIWIGRRHVPLGRALLIFRNQIRAQAQMPFRRTHMAYELLRLRDPSALDSADASLHVLPASLLPDDLWLSQIDHWRRKEQLPRGTDLAAWLGSGLATTDAVSREGAAFEPFVRSAAASRRRYRVQTPSLPDLYFKTLSALFEKPDPSAPAFMAGEAWQRKSLQTALAGWAQFRHTWELQPKYLEINLGGSVQPAGFVEPDPEFFHRMGDMVDSVEDTLVEQGVFADSPSGQVASRVPNGAIELSPGHDLWQRWRQLDRTTHALEVLVQKELRGVDWSQEDAKVFRTYAAELGFVMGYEGASSANPRDNAPRWTTVARDQGSDRNFAIAVGRPRALYVLYPWHGAQVLCRGAVMSYYEYEAPRRLTDAEWKEQLDSAHPIQQPDWIQPLLPVSK
jgi:hypothetical protein